jgi:predicted Zn-ribbon and HTH transcriptional regulator
MFRKGLINTLLDTPMTVSDIARLMELSPRDVEEDLRHMTRSLKRSEYRLRVRPASCRKCGFEFGADKLRKPGKCPRCHATWIREPLLEVTRVAGHRVD